MSRAPTKVPWDPMLRASGGHDAFGNAVDGEFWGNRLYSCFVRRTDDSAMVLSIHRRDRRPIRDWRHFQRIKNEVAGPEREAVELYPSESRLVDTANEYWLWVLPEGKVMPVGFPERAVADTIPDDFPGARQRPR